MPVLITATAAIYAPRIEWGYEHVEVSAAQAMRAENNGKAAVSATQSAKDFLERTVKDEPIPQTEIEEAMQGEHFKMRTLHQVKKDLGIESKRINGKWC